MRRPRTLPFIIAPGPRVLFVGINPGLRSAAVGHHFAGASNRFWKLLFDSGLVPEPLTWRDDGRLPEWGYGLTNLVDRATRGVGDIRPDEYRAGRQRLLRRVRRWRPRIVALVGVTLFRHVFLESRDGRARLGLQRRQTAGVPVFLLPNPSGRNAHFSYQHMLRAFRGLRKYISQPSPRALSLEGRGRRVDPPRPSPKRERGRASPLPAARGGPG